MMKRIFLTFFILATFLGNIMLSYGRGKSSASKTWSLTLANQASQEAYSARQTQDGGFVIGITATAKGRGTSMVIAKVSSTGSLQWEKNYGPGRVVSVVPLNAGGYAIVGARLIKVGTGIDASLLILMLDANGNPEWKKESRRGLEPTGIEEGPNGNLFVYGNSTSYNGSAFLMKLRKDGQTIWQKQIGSRNGWPGVSFQIAKNGNCFFGFGLGSHEYHIYKIKLDGIIIWKRIYKTSIFNASSFKSLRPTPDGGFIVTEQLPLISKYDKNGSPEWVKYYTTNTMAVVYSMVVNNAGDTLLVGQIGNVNGHPDVWVLKINKSGNILWHKRFGRNFVDRAWQASVTRDNHFLIAGRLGRGALQGANAWVLKLDRNGIVNDSCNFAVHDIASQLEHPQLIRLPVSHELKKAEILMKNASAIQNDWSSNPFYECGQE